MSQALVLVADDDQDQRSILGTMLRHAGFAAIEAGNGAEAVERVREHVPDLILMDLRMPVVNGLEAMRVLREAASSAGVPVVAMTAYDVSPASIRAAGFCALLVKPVLPRDVVRAIERCLAGAAERRTWIDLQDRPEPLPPAGG